MKIYWLSALSEKQKEVYYSSRLFLEQTAAYFQFTDSSISYYKEYFGSEYKDYSLIVFDEYEPVIVLYAFSKGMKLGFFESPLQILNIDFASTQNEFDAFKVLISKLNSLTKNGISELYFYENPHLLSNYYSKIISTSLEFSSYVRLTLDTSKIKSALRKSYKSLVNWGEKNLSVEILDSFGFDEEKFNSFHKFHYETSGRETRSSQTWELQKKAIKNGDAFLVLGFLNGKLVAGTLVLMGKKIAYYGVGVYDRLLMTQNIAVAHYCVFYAICQAQKLGLKIFDLGFIDQSNVSGKEANIFKFKRGFGNLMQAKIKYSTSIQSDTNG